MEETNASESMGNRWGVWSTLGFSLIVVILYIVAQIIVAAVVIGIRLSQSPDADIQTLAAALETDGLFFSFSILFSALLCGGLIILFAALRKGITIKQYLYFTPLPLRIFIRWLTATIVFAMAWDGLSFLLGRAIVPEFMVAAYQSAGNYPLFWFSIVIAGPFLEELFFRGFLFEGLRASRLGPVGAIILTSIFWAAIHTQYGMYEIVTIFLLGLLLGAAKTKTESLYIPFAMHAFSNLLATAEVALL